MTTGTDLARHRAHPLPHATGQGRHVRKGHTPDKWDLLSAVEKARTPLGLKGTSITLLRALLSFMREDVVALDRADRHICFASNAALAERAHVSVQTVERHISLLVKHGLLLRVTNGNGKRWARRDRAGRVTLAAGLSVSPLLDRYAELCAMAEAHRDLLDRLAALRDRCLMALAELRRRVGETETVQAASRLLRCKPRAEPLTELLHHLEKAVDKQGITQGETEKTKGRDTQIEGHKEPKNEPEVISADHQTPSDTDYQAAFPTLCAELRTATSQHDCEERMQHLSACIGLRRIWSKLCQKPASLRFMILGYLLERIEKIRNPKAYALALMRDIDRGTVDWRSLLTPPSRYRLNTGA